MKEVASQKPWSIIMTAVHGFVRVPVKIIMDGKDRIEMKFTNHSVFALMAIVGAALSVNAFAAQKGRTIASKKPACGSQDRANQEALKRAQEDNPGKTCTQGASTLDGPGGGFFKTYHVTFDCGDGGVNYDSETHLQGVPGHLVCTTSVAQAGAFEANDQ